MMADEGPQEAGSTGRGGVWRRDSRVIGDLQPARGGDAAAGRSLVGGREGCASEPSAPDEPVAVILELNTTYPGGLSRVRTAFEELTSRVLPDVSLTQITSRLYQAILSRRALADLLAQDRSGGSMAPVIFKAWPDYPMTFHVDRSAPTVKVTAAHRSFSADGAGIVWAVIDTGIDATHPHFAALELAREGTPGEATTSSLHRDFSWLVPTPVKPTSSPLTDEDGHGTHIAGIIAGACPSNATPQLGGTGDPGSVTRTPGVLSGMAPTCQLVSIKVARNIGPAGDAVTSSSAVIKALDYILTEVNANRSTLRIQGVNISLGCEWDASHYAAGQSPLCHLITQVVQSGVLVVVSSGNNGGTTVGSNQFAGVGATITEPGHADACITVGSTHRDSPHVFGVTWTSSKGPTLDGRAKPDIVAPGEAICSAVAGRLRNQAGLARRASKTKPPYAEHSGTSQAAAHVSGILAGFLSARPEYIGRPDAVKALLTATATDLGRDRMAQGAGLIDAMRMLTSS